TGRAADILKRASFNAAIALLLFSLMVGIRTERGPNVVLIYWTRFGELASLVCIVFGGSIVIELLRLWLRPKSAEKQMAPAVQRVVLVAGRFLSIAGHYLWPALLVFAFFVPIIFYDNSHWLGVAIQVLIYVMLGWGLNVVVGLAGLLDLGYVAFYAV